MKGLFILFYYLPVDTANAIQNYRLIAGIEQTGIEPTIFTRMADGTSSRITDYKTKNVYQFKPRNTDFLEPYFEGLVRDAILFPDIQRYSWVNPVKKHIEALIHSTPFDFIHTNSLPHSSHLLGAYLKKKYNFRWVAQFYEGWVDNFVNKSNNRFIRWTNKRQEKHIAEEADLIIHSNHIIKRRWAQRYGRSIEEKIEVLPMCTDPDIVPNAHSENPSKYTLIHAGNLYKKRNLDLLIKALQLLKNKFRNLEDLLTIQLVGSIHTNIRESIRQNSLESVFQIIGRRPYDEVRKVVEKANALLLIEFLEPDENIFFPSKICEYFSYQKIIIGILPKTSVARNYLTESGHFIVGKDQHLKLSGFLESLITKNEKIQFDTNYYKSFLPDRVAGLYKSYLIKHHII